MNAEQFLKLSLKDGDMVFVDREAVSLNEISHLRWPAIPNVLFVMVMVPPGKSIADVVQTYTREELLQLIGDKS